MIFCLNSNLIKIIYVCYHCGRPHKDEHDLKGHERSHKARLAKLFSAHSFIHLYLIKMLFFLKIKHDLRSHITTFMLCRGCMAFLLTYFRSYDNLYSRSYGQLLALFVQEFTHLVLKQYNYRIEMYIIL